VPARTHKRKLDVIIDAAKKTQEAILKYLDLYVVKALCDQLLISLNSLVTYK